MKDRIARRAHQIRAEQTRAHERIRTAELAAERHQQHITDAAEHIGKLLAMPWWRQLFLDREQKLVLRREEARLTREAWIEANCGYIDQLCDTFRNWALRAGARPNLQGAWEIHAAHSKRVETKHISGDDFPIHTTYAQTTQWFIPIEEQEHYDPNSGFSNIKTYLTEREGSTPPPGMAGYSTSEGSEGMAPYPLRPLDDAAAQYTIAALEEGVAQWVAKYPRTPWTGTIERYAPDAGLRPIYPADLGLESYRQL